MVGGEGIDAHRARFDSPGYAGRGGGIHAANQSARAELGVVRQRHRPRITDRVTLNKLIQILVPGAADEKTSDSTCSAMTIRCRRDEWINAGIFTALEQIALASCDRIPGLELADLAVDGCLVKARCGGHIATKGVPAPIQNTSRWVVKRANPRMPEASENSPSAPTNV